MVRAAFSMAILISISQAPGIVLAQADNESRYSWYVEGVTKNGPVKSETYSTKQRAVEELQTWTQEHGPGGLLEADPFVEGPFLMRVYNGKAEPVRPDAVDPDKPQARPGTSKTDDGKLDLFKGLKDKKWVDPQIKTTDSKAASSVAGKKATGTIGKYKVSVEFRGTGNSGDVIISGEASAKGTWKLEGSLVTMETANFTYRAKIEGEKIAGLQFGRKADSKAADWAVRFLTREEYFRDQIPGSYTIKNPSGDGTTRWTFRSDGTLITTYSLSSGSNETKRTWDYNPKTGEVNAYRDGQRWGIFMINERDGVWNFWSETGQHLKKLKSPY